MTSRAVRLALVALAATLPWMGAPALDLDAPAQAAPAVRSGHAAGKKKAPAKKRARGQISRRHGHAFLERHVVAIKGGMPNVQALGALVIDETGRELYARNPDKERPIASISKLAATLAVADRGLELDGLSTIEKADIDVARGGARSRLVAGMTLSNRDLLHAALMGSDNRAIPALGRAVKLTPSQLTAAMNAKAHDLGLKNTRFREPTGLSPDNVSTPRETIKMLRAAMAHPVLGPITNRIEYDAHPVGRPSLRYVNTDHAASRGTIQVLGGKTGYNDIARYCLVVATKIDGRQYFMSFLSNEGKLTRFGDVARVADWLVVHKPKGPAAVPPPIPTAATPPTSVATAPAAPSGGAGEAPSSSGVSGASVTLPVGVAAPPPDDQAPTANP